MTIAIHVDQQRDESLLGASEAAGVLGLDKYNPPIKIWRRHRGMPTHDDMDQNEPAYWGTVLEPVVRGKYAIDRRVRVFVPATSYTLDGWLRCTPDGLVEEPTPIASHIGTEEIAGVNEQIVRGLHTAGRLGGLQVKTCSAWLEDDWRDGPPAKYEVQCRVEMAVADLPWVDIVCLCGGQKQLGPFRLMRDAELERRILESLHEFWGMVTFGREPTVDHTDAWRLHVSEKLDRVLPTMIAAHGELLTGVADWRECRRVRKLSERAEDKGKNALLLAMSAAGATKLDAGDMGRITAYRTSKGTWALRTPTNWKDDDR